MKHKEGPLACGCLLKEAGPPLDLAGGMVLKDWRIVEPCPKHKTDGPSIFSVCMKCETVYGAKVTSEESRGRLSHGYCQPCGADILKSV